jgi:hypothetical protein
LVTAAVNQGYAPVASPSFTGNVTVAGWLAVEGNASPILDVALGVYSALNPPDATAGSVTTGGLFVGNAANPTLYYRNTNHIFNDRSGATSMAQISASGFIVGTPTGGAKGAGTINATTVYAAGVALTSDARLKSDVGDLPADCLGLVAAITPKTFKHLPPPAPELGSGMPGDPAPKAEPTPNFYDRTMWGFMAQDVEAVMAAGGHDFGGHIVSEDGMQSLSYFDLLAVVWKALQEATARIEQLEAGPAAA